jgi:glycopeptide antibiotics resistance protein
MTETRMEILPIEPFHSAAPARPYPERMSPKRRGVARVLLGTYLLALALIVFLPARDAGRVTGIIGWVAEGLSTFGVPREAAAVALEFLANIALFVPFGVLFRLALPRLSAWSIVATGAGVSIGIELAQLAIPSRVASISDVVANTAGAAIGLAFTLWWAHARHPLGSDRSPT